MMTSAQVVETPVSPQTVLLGSLGLHSPRRSYFVNDSSFFALKNICPFRLNYFKSSQHEESCKQRFNKSLRFHFVRVGQHCSLLLYSCLGLNAFNSDNYRLDEGGRGFDRTPTPSYLIASVRGVNLRRSKTVTKRN